MAPPTEPLRVMIAGAPASGKGTQCAKIVEKYGLVHISVGDLLRAEVNAGTPAGRKAKSFMDSGALVPDEVVVDMVKNKLAEPEVATKGWLLDGYPRSGAQAAAIDAVGIKPDVFLLINVPDDKLVERVIGRRSDPETGEIYHLTFKPPPPEIISRLVQRSDDTEEMVRNRLDTYHKHLEAITNYYRDLMVEISGDRSMEEVFSAIEAAIAIAPHLSVQRIQGKENIISPPVVVKKEPEARETALSSLPAMPLTPSQSVPSPAALTAALNDEPLRVIIAGAPASGKGTQCAKIVEKYGLVHISIGELLRAEVAAGSPVGKKAKSFMDSGSLVPDEVVVEMVKNKLGAPDVASKGWLLDGYPRSGAQAAAIQAVGIRPDIFLFIVVPDDQLVERVIGRLSDPITGEIYHLKFRPPPTDINYRLVRRPDDIESLMRTRLEAYHKHMDSIVCTYRDVMVEIRGDRSMEEVFQSIEAALATVPDLRSKLESGARGAVANAIALWERQRTADSSGASTPALQGDATPIRKLSGRRIAAIEDRLSSAGNSFTSASGSSFTKAKKKSIAATLTANLAAAAAALEPAAAAAAHRDEFEDDRDSSNGSSTTSANGNTFTTARNNIAAKLTTNLAANGSAAAPIQKKQAPAVLHAPPPAPAREQTTDISSTHTHTRAHTSGHAAVSRFSPSPSPVAAAATLPVAAPAPAPRSGAGASNPAPAPVPVVEPLAPQKEPSPTGAPLKVMIAGAPASGKGTQCARIVEKYGLVHISVGDLLRLEAAAGTAAGKRAKSFMDSGALVPDEVVVDMVKNKLAEPEVATKGWLLDGYPRSGAQAAAIDAVGINPDVFLLIKVPDDKIVERVVGRRSDPETGEIYHLTFKPPPPEIISRLVQRSDDTEEMVRNRLDTYHKHVNAVLEYYRDYIVEIGGDKSMDEVFLGVETAIAIAPLLKPRPPLVITYNS